MKPFLLPLLALTLAPTAEAARPDLRALTCRQATGLIEERKAITVTTGKFTYARVYSSRAFCPETSDLKVAAIAVTLDNRSCKVGYLCQPEYLAGNGSSIIGASAPISCPEGKLRVESRRDNSSDHQVQVTMQCQSGKWVEVD